MNDEQRREIDLAVGEIVRNVTNFPEKVHAYLWGQDMGPLREAIVAKIEERLDGAAHFAAVTAPLSAEERLRLQFTNDESLFADTLRAARALAKVELLPGDGGHDAANLQEMLAFVLERHDALNLIITVRSLGEERHRAAIQRVIDYTENGDIGTQQNADALTDELCAALGLPPRRPVVASVEVEFRDVSPEVVSLITGGVPLTDEDRIEAAARSIANLEPGEPWPSNDDLGGHPMLGTRDDEYRDNIRDTARAALKAAGVIS